MGFFLKSLTLAAATSIFWQSSLISAIASHSPLIKPLSKDRGLLSSLQFDRVSFGSEITQSIGLTQISLKEPLEELGSGRSVDKTTELNRLIALGETYNSQGDYQQAIEVAKSSLALAQELQNRSSQSTALITLASAYEALASNKSDYQKATSAALASLSISWNIKDRLSEAKALAILGSVYNSMGEDESASIFSRQALKVSQENRFSDSAATSLLNLASVQLKLEDYPQVAEFTQEGINYLDKQPEKSAALVMLGLANFGQGKLQDSSKIAEEGLALSQKMDKPLIEALALIVLSLKDREDRAFGKAIERLNQSLAIAQVQANSELEATILELIADNYHKLGDKERAIATYQQAILKNDSYTAKAGLASVYQDLNLAATAITYYKQAINKLEEKNPQTIPGIPSWLQKSFPKALQNINGTQSTDIYRSLITLLIVQGRLPEAQQVLELLKGQELREYTEDSEAVNPTFNLAINPIEEKILQENGSLIAFGQRVDQCQRTNCFQLQMLTEQRQVLNQQYYQTLQQLESELQRHPPKDETFLDPNQFNLKAKRIVESQPGTVLIYPLFLENKLWLLWAAKGGIFKSIVVEDVTQAQFEVTSLQFRQLLQNRLSNLEELKATSQQLYDWLIKPIEGELKNNDIHHLIFSLDGSLRYIPLSALFDGEKYLVENYTVSTVISANLTNKSPRRGVGHRDNSSASTFDSQVLAVGVSEALAGFKPLPNVPPELDAIVRRDGMDGAGIYPGREYLNDEFSFFSLRDNLGDRQILHIATHAEFIPRRANQSYLLLGTGEKLALPGIETWLNLRDVNLVVLSACETALGGPGLDGREIAGMGYYFLKGGAKTVVASLWNVDDRSTRLLMEEFYQNLAQESLTSSVAKSQALRQAQLSLLKDNSDLNTNSASTPSFRHPYYWAGFILMETGEW